jgi:molybdate transport system substrate-binding protein
MTPSAAEIGFAQICELLSVPDVNCSRPLPSGARRLIILPAGVVSGAKEPNAARAVIELLASPAAVAAFSTSGLEPAVVRASWR